jgi:RNA polymerase sigma-70 factor, ECF subfamily
VRQCLRRNQPGRYQFQAAIAAVHSDTLDASATGWSQIVALYDQLYKAVPTDIVWMNRAIAVAENDGPQAGLDALATVKLDSYYLFHATRAELYARLGRHDDAQYAYDRAIDLATNDAERRYLERRRNTR